MKTDRIRRVIAEFVKEAILRDWEPEKPSDHKRKYSNLDQPCGAAYLGFHEGRLVAIREAMKLVMRSQSSMSFCVHSKPSLSASRGP